MVRSTDPQRETLRLTQWPSFEVAKVRSLRCLELVLRKPSWPAFMCERIKRPDIWTQAV